MDQIKKFYKNKKILITGATGFKGSWLCSWLLEMGAKVYGTGFTPNQNKNLFYDLRLNKRIKLKIIDIRDYNRLKKFINKAIPLTFVTGMIFLIAIYFLNSAYKLDEAIYKVIFIGLASLTFPHILLEYLLEKNEKRT